MVAHLAAQVERGAARQLLLGRAAMIFSTAGADAAQVAPVHVGVHVEDRLHVVVVDDLGRDAALDAGQVGEQLRGSPDGAPGLP